MSARIVRKSLIGAVVAAAILVGGIWAGRLAAGPLGRGHRFSAQQIFARIADRLDLSDTQRGGSGSSQIAQDAILATISRSERRAARPPAVDRSRWTRGDSGARRRRSAGGADASVLRAQIRSSPPV